jgi:pectate lyase
MLMISIWGQTATNAYEGYGYSTLGGAGGDTYHVTTLADGGPGSLRDGVFNRSGPRTIVFDVGGTIFITNLFKLNVPYVTIDGATAPAPGITLSKKDDWTEFVISGTHDVIIRHLRFQGLYLRGADEGSQDTAFLAIDGDWDPDYYAHHIVLDHLTILNATDAALDIWGEVSDVTVSWCLIANNYHPSTLSFIPDPGQAFQKRRRISMHHNVWARNNERNPQLRADTSDFDYVNNIIYDWGYWEGRGYGVRIRNDDGEPKVDGNFINNYFLPGAVYPSWALVYGVQPGPDQTDDGPATTLPQGTVVSDSVLGKLWVAGNILPAENMDHYSTIAQPNPVPTNARVTTYRAIELKDRVVPDVGMKFRSAEEQALLLDMAGAMQSPAQIKILNVTPATTVLELKTTSGFSNQLQFADRLAPDAWTSITNFTSHGESLLVTNVSMAGSNRFYRVIATPAGQP